MLPTSSAREKFSKWPEASRILVYDADSASIPQTQASNLLGLMRKFRGEGFPQEREVAWLRGGFHAVWRDYPDLVNDEPPAEEVEDDDAQAEADAAPLSKTMSAPPATRALRAKQLPMAAFTSATTIPLRPRGMPPPTSVPMQLVPPTPAMPRDDPFAKVSAIPPTPAFETAPMPAPLRSGDFALRLPPMGRPKTVGGTSGPRGPLYSMPTLSPQYTHSGAYNRTTSFSVPGRQVAFNPFFDTIRQNIELGNRDAKAAHGEGIPLKLPRRVRQRVGELPFEWIRQIARKSRRVTDSSSTTEDSDSSASDLDVPGEQSTSGPEIVGSGAPSRPPRFDAMARRSPPKSRSSSPSQPIPIPLTRTRPDASSSSPSSPTPSSHSLSPPDAEELTRALEAQFYNIELGEQKRLLGVMERHSLESGKVIQEGGGVRGALGAFPQGKPLASATTVSQVDAEGAAAVGEEAASSFPYSITAGLEKGAKNRYRNIWPFEHARVRLRKTKPDDDDYMNASYVQPLGTTKRYIATQGPLPATFADFWTLCWEQNVHVIVMLTREIEGSSVKCGKYWEEGSYGTLRLRMLESNDTPEREQKRRDLEINSGFFRAHVPQAKPKAERKEKRSREREDSSTIKRVFELTNTAYPLAPPRIVTQFQYLEWPDLNVPEDPRGLLNLIRQVENAVEQSRSTGEKQWGEGPLHRRTRVKKTSPERPTLGNAAVAGADPSAEVDPSTGVSLLAKENAPVLLHCSAGVGRTGGFIAVDAVLDGIRREMRKRKEGKVKETATVEEASTLGQGRSGTASSSRSQSTTRSTSWSPSLASPTPDLMEIDSTPRIFGSGQEGSQLTAPVDAGDREVHVPVAGFTDAVPMDIDERQEAAAINVKAPVPSTFAFQRGDVPTPLMQASPELVGEVRRATFRAWPSTSLATPSPLAGPSMPPLANASVHRGASSVLSGSSSDSFTRSSIVNSRSRSSASPPTSQTDSSTSVMVGKTARLTMASPSPPTKEASLPPSDAANELLPSSARPKPTPAGQTQQGPEGAHHPPSRPSSKSHRLNSWRSEVQSSDLGLIEESSAPTPSNSSKPSHSSSSDTVKEGLEVAAPVGLPSPDLKEPRRLHDDTTPPLLSIYEDPIRRVVEDMREQRMSLCQSLRQYVFVHRAIIEGALVIVDEEKKRKGSLQEFAEAGPSKTQVPPIIEAPQPISSVSSMSVDPTQASAAEGVQAHGMRFGQSFVPSDEREVSRKRSYPEFVAGDTIVEGVVSPASVASAGRPKRVGSPAELTKEDVDGGVLLTKRPSVKRRQRPSDVGGQRPTFDAVLLSSQPPPDAR
ncbi:Receptor-type tyrosine-protein phosphatase gamma [Trametes pubescens]|uniref:Receptor-type tyrosine-protein phosphatase gamma n=1 Tax=Trametes pubescens TaxID=154538 RepID=A0A1M2VK05_TRAPU|nr:Receptor-type tyrosine-protein phosphatase gamma [Trametes pubescens]